MITYSPELKAALATQPKNGPRGNPVFMNVSDHYEAYKILVALGLPVSKQVGVFEIVNKRSYFPYDTTYTMAYHFMEEGVESADGQSLNNIASYSVDFKNLTIECYEDKATVGRWFWKKYASRMIPV